MRRLAPGALVAVLAVLVVAPAASADTFTVDDNGDGGDANPGNGSCATGGGGCTLRAALEEANAFAGADEVVVPSGVGEIQPAATLEATEQVTVRGGATVRWQGPANQPLLLFAAGAGGSAVEDLQLIGGGTAGIDVSTAGMAIRRVRVSGSDGHGIDLNGNATLVTRSGLFANAGQPIAESPVGRPQGLRVGPRRPDGALPVTGTTAGGGVLELFRGNPTASSPISFLAGPNVGAGAFSHVLASEPAPASTISATITTGGSTSGFSAARVPFDVQSPSVIGAVAISQNEVTIQFSEPIRADSIQPDDFGLVMAGSPRPVTAIRIEPGGAQVTISSTAAWGHGEAGFLQTGPAGAFLDAGGNASLAGFTVRVAAAPGDLIPPVGSSLNIRPSSFCITRSRRCRRTGTNVRFVGSEGGRAHIVLMRGNRRIGVDEALAGVGRNRVRFNGRLGNRKLRPGRYRMLLYLEDEVGNMTVEPPIQLFTVRPAR